MRHRVKRALVIVLGLDLAWHLLHIGALVREFLTGERPQLGGSS